MSHIEKVCFDRILPSKLHQPPTGRMLMLSKGPARAAFEIAKLWPNGKVLHIRFLNGTEQQKQIVKQFAPQWTEHANLKFVFDDAPSAEIRIAFNDDGAWSYIGTDSLGIPVNQPTMNFGWQEEGVVLHEFGHLIGMIHEHQNPNGNAIVWNKPAVIKALSGPPNNWDLPTIQHNMFDKYSQTQINGSELDPASVMLYSFPVGWTLNGFHSKPNEVLSPVDMTFAGKIYPKQPVVAGPVELTLGTAKAASIGLPGEEDLYKLNVQAAGRYVIETQGTTDVIMKLYGPSNTLIAEDDDGGVGLNSRIVRQLMPGDYLIQIRHYNRAGGTGKYAVKATKS